MPNSYSKITYKKLANLQFLKYYNCNSQFNSFQIFSETYKQSHFSRSNLIQNCKNITDAKALIETHKDKMTVQDIVNIIDTIKRLPGAIDLTFMDDLSKKIIEDHIMIRPRLIARIFHACAKLGYFNSELFEICASQVMLPFQVK